MEPTLPLPGQAHNDGVRRKTRWSKKKSAYVAETAGLEAICHNFVPSLFRFTGI